MTQAQQIWHMLDDMAANDPTGYKKLIDEQMKQSRQRSPQPVLYIETTIYKPKKGKLFINFFQWACVPKPKSDEDPIPVIGSQPLWSKHSSDASILCVAFNENVTKLLTESSTHHLERKALINLAIDFLNDHHSASISRSYTVPQDKLCHGHLPTLQKAFNVKQTPDINDLKNLLDDHPDIKIPGVTPFLADESYGENEISKNFDVKLLDNNIIPKDISKPLIEELLATPEYTCVESGDELNGVCDIYTVELPGVTSVDQCQLDITQGNIDLLVEAQYSLSVKLTDQSDDGRATAKFIRRSSKLVISVPRKNNQYQIDNQ